MTSRKNSALVGILAAVFMAAGPAPDEARAQDMVRQGMQMLMQLPDPMPMRDGEETIRVRVRFNIVVPLGGRGSESLARAEARGRAAIYRMAEDECAVLQSTIAATCRMSGIRIRSRARGRHRVPSTSLSVYGNARYAITLKGS